MSWEARTLPVVLTVLVATLAACSPIAPLRGASPPQSGSPTPLPVPSGSIALPASIDATGSSDVSGALNSFIAGVPDGSTIAFRAGGTYRLGSALKFAHRHGLTLLGNGATLLGAGGTTEASSLIWLGNYGGADSGIAIRDLTLVGNSPSPGEYQPGREGAHGILVDGGSGIEIRNVTVRGVWGDAFYVGGWADGVSIHDSEVVSAGRNGVTITSGRNVTVERVAFDRTGYVTFDIEPNRSSEGASDIRFAHNTVGSWGTWEFFAADGAPGSVVQRVTVTGNTLTGATLRSVVDLPRRADIVFTDNTSLVTASGPVLTFAHVDGLTVTGNVQPLVSGGLAAISDSTAVTYQP